LVGLIFIWLKPRSLVSVQVDRSSVELPKAEKIHILTGQMKSESEWCLLAKQCSNAPIWLASKIWTSFAFSDGNASAVTYWLKHT